MDKETKNPLEGFSEVKEGEVFEFKKPGDFVDGELIDVRVNVGKNNSMMYDLRAGDKIFSVWGSTVLDGKMRKVRKGDFIRIVFKGLVPKTKEHREYKDFAVGIKDAIGDFGDALGDFQKKAKDGEEQALI